MKRVRYGLVVSYNEARGYGFIRQEGYRHRDQDVYFHMTDARLVIDLDTGPDFARRTPDVVVGVGTRLVFREVPGEHGRWKATPWGIEQPFCRPCVTTRKDVEQEAFDK